VLVRMAYSVKSYQIKGPPWLDTERYDVIAKIPKGASDQLPAMVQSLLADRFKLALHKDTQPLQAYELTIATGGPKMKEVDPAEVAAAAAAKATGVPLQIDREATRRGAMPPIGASTFTTTPDGAIHSRSKMTMPEIISWFGNLLGRNVVDSTGLKGTYEIDLTYAPVSETDREFLRAFRPPADPAAGAPTNAPEASTPIPDLFQAVEHTLGLKLTSKTLPTEILYIDSANRTPTEN